jgi:hypothetical protein
MSATTTMYADPINGEVAASFRLRKGIAEWSTWASGCMDDALANVSYSATNPKDMRR